MGFSQSQYFYEDGAGNRTPIPAECVYRPGRHPLCNYGLLLVWHQDLSPGYADRFLSSYV
ncbi:hypothetical protein [Rossellomorea arthrocnemi]|uniref:hypothetical protein n=1 Tax=Rossellomorea arthrocnemi TaxID=2769542 RepID=UPI0038B5E94D